MKQQVRQHPRDPSRVAFDTTRHLTQVELARRWRASHRTLERYRYEKKGPPYLKIGGRVLYRLEDIEVFEAEQLHGPAAFDPWPGYGDC
ncbi:helix-turn-helix domain-containing protein [Belnapia sp. T18]|uniref:Helix-turn-helix domain-containing protein n=1 Tax=Belnapia arida TaxID=2804533 RepID=A0ABS1UCG5_9PROT|nr:helix-turn-helix domain-containing protein [Belnapia arida]MBL6082377.1 helix-turn-helix domain-containing protein [Belnapia arida]